MGPGALPQCQVTSAANPLDVRRDQSRQSFPVALAPFISRETGTKSTLGECGSFWGEGGLGAPISPVKQPEQQSPSAETPTPGSLPSVALPVCGEKELLLSASRFLLLGCGPSSTTAFLQTGWLPRVSNGTGVCVPSLPLVAPCPAASEGISAKSCHSPNTACHYSRPRTDKCPAEQGTALDPM